jgi:DNA polymerase I-like protein with 3'-5' exonuclease and polymerase domains
MQVGTGHPPSRDGSVSPRRCVQLSLFPDFRDGEQVAATAAAASSAGSSTPAAPSNALASAAAPPSGPTGGSGSPPSGGALEEHHEVYLSERAVPVPVALAAGLRSITAEEATRVLGRARLLASGGLAIPHYGVNPEYVRVRFDEPELVGARYLTQPGRPVPLYVPPPEALAAAATHRAAQAGTASVSGPTPNTTVPASLVTAVVVVESPIKALAMVAAGVEAVGLGGTGTTLTPKGEEHRLNDSWPSMTGRDVIALFDAGRANNPNVARDEARLLRALKLAGASVRVAALPPGANGGDQGPDDFLAAKGPAAVWTVLQGAVAGDPLQRVQDVIALNNPAAVNGLLDDLPFRLAAYEAPVGEQRNIKAALLGAGVKAADWTAMLKAVKEALRDAAKDSNAVTAVGGVEYEVSLGRLAVVEHYTDAKGRQKTNTTPLCNFTAEIVEEVTFDDGMQEKRVLTLAGKIAAGPALPPAEIEVQDFMDHLWPLKTWGTVAQTAAENSTAAHLRLAIQQQSSPVKRRVYSHTGWTLPLDETGVAAGVPVFLHAGGAVGAEGLEVRLDAKLSKYRLPAVVEDPLEAIRASLALLDVAPMAVTVPLLLGVYMAPLVSMLTPFFSIFLVGKTGSLKTAVATLFSAHDGEDLLDRPVATFGDSIAALEARLSVLKDVVALVDDFKPRSTNTNDDMRQRAAVLFSMVGNAEGRARMRSDGTPRTDRPPRGLVIATGEMLPEGESTIARLLPLTLKAQDVRLDALTQAQRDAWRLPHARLAYINWLRPQVGSLAKFIERRFAEHRVSFRKVAAGHLRSPGALAFLAVGAEMLATFAKAEGVYSEEEARRALNVWLKVLQRLGAEAGQRAQEADPAHRFVEVLSDLVQGGKVAFEHNLGMPLTQDRTTGAVVIGWCAGKGEPVYLLQDATFRTVSAAMSVSGEPLPYAAKPLWQRLRDLGVIEKGDRDDRLTQRHVLGAERVAVVVMAWDKLHLPDDPPSGGVPAGGAGGGSNRTNPTSSGTTAGTDRTTATAPPSPGTSSPSSQLFEEKEEGRRDPSSAGDAGPDGPVRSPQEESSGGDPAHAGLSTTAHKIRAEGPPLPGPSGPSVPMAPNPSPSPRNSVVPTVSAPRTSGPRVVYLEPNPDAARQPAFRWRGETGAWVSLVSDTAKQLTGVTVVMHDAKAALFALATYKVRVGGVRCTQTAARLLADGGSKALTFDAACRLHLGRAGAVATLAQLDQALQRALREAGLEKVAELEFSLLPVIGRMERAGVGVDARGWRELVERKGAELARLAERLRDLLGLDHPERDGDVAAALRAKGILVTRTGAEALLHHRSVPGVSDLLEYRPLAGFLGDVGPKVLKAINSTNYFHEQRVYPRVDTLGAATGRMSCSEPNFMAVPREEAVRRCVVPAKGMVFVVADYNAIELRALAQVTGDENLRAVFHRGGDPHRHTAAVLLGKAESDVTPEERQKAKPLNFGIAFGMGAEGLVEHAGLKFGVEITVAEAQRFHDGYLSAHPQVSAWQNGMERAAPAEVRTGSGRRRSNFSRKHGYTERLATQVQGTAADGMKRALVLLDERLAAFGARIVLCVHDEVLVEAPSDRAAEVREVVIEVMKAGMAEFITSVPIVVEASIRTSWAKEAPNHTPV